jgi:hypothetical protein
MVSETICEDDKAVSKIDLENILAEEEMRRILGGILEQSGWEQGQEGGSFHKTMEDGTEMTWDVENGEVAATVEITEDVKKKVEVSGYADQDYNDYKKRAQQDGETKLKRAEQAARDDIRARSDEIRKKATKLLNDNEEARTAEINEVLSQTYGQAIRQRARQLGNVVSEHESTVDGQYQLTIKIAE